MDDSKSVVEPIEGEKKKSPSKGASLIQRMRSRSKSTTGTRGGSNLAVVSRGTEGVATDVPCEKMAADGTLPQSQGTPGKRLTILSIDGGGVRGLIPAVCLDYLESQLQALDGPEARIADYFDIVAGTSTGGIIAAMLTAPDEKKRPKFTAKEVKQFYIDESITIFPKPGAFSSITGFLGPKYSAAPLKKLLVDNFKDLKVADALTDVMITSFDVKTQQPVFFNTVVGKRVPRFNASLVDVCLGTTAAPTFLPAHQFEVSDPDSGAGKTHQYNLVDGGIAANNPTEVAILHSIKDLTIGDSPHRGRLDFSGYKDLLVLSFGTGDQTVSYDAKDMAGWGTLSWVLNDGKQPIIQMFQNSSAYVVDFDIAIRFQIDDVEENYLRLETSAIDGDLAALDNSSAKNMQNLVDVANKLLDEKAKYRSATDGELVDKPYMGTNNREALSCFAKWLTIEKKARQEDPTLVTSAIAPPGPGTGTGFAAAHKTFV